MTEEVEQALDRFQASGELSPEDAQQIKSEISRGSEDLPEALVAEKAGELTEEESVDIRAKISKMTIPQKIKVAMFGSSVIRGILIFDSNKIIQEFVLKNPRLGLNEVEGFTKATCIS